MVPSEGWEPTEWTPPPSPAERQEQVRRAEAVARAALMWAVGVADLTRSIVRLQVQMEAFSECLAVLKGLDDLGVIALDEQGED